MTPTAPTFAHHDALAALGRSLQATGYRFVTVTPATHRRVNNRPENAWAHDLRGVFGWSRPFRQGTLAPALMELMERAGVLANEAGLLRSTVRASTLDGVLYFHSAYPTDDKDAVFFGPDTCRFAAAIRRALDTLPAPPARVADIGCGAGPGAIVVARHFPQAEVIAADINDSALALAAVNARLAGAANVTTRHSDLLAGLDGDVDLVVCNPPYVIDPQGRAYRNGGGETGMDLSLAVVEASLARLRPGGALLLYTGVAIAGDQDRFRSAISPRLDKACAHWTYEELDPDVFGEELEQPGYANAERIAAVWLHATRPI